MIGNFKGLNIGSLISPFFFIISLSATFSFNNQLIQIILGLEFPSMAYASAFVYSGNRRPKVAWKWLISSAEKRGRCAGVGKSAVRAGIQKFFRDEECIRKAARLGLFGKGERQAPMGAAAEQMPEEWQIHLFFSIWTLV